MSLISFVTLLLSEACIMGEVSKTPLNREHYRAIRQIEQLGGTVYLKSVSTQDPDACCPLCGSRQKEEVEAIHIEGERFTDAQLELLAPFRSHVPDFIGVERSGVSAEGVRRLLREFPSLRHFAMRSPFLGDEALTELHLLKDLEHLDLSDSKITSVTLGRVAGLKRLRVLFVSNTAVDDAGLRHLEGLSELEWLWLDGTKVTSAGMASLAKLKKLDTLLLHNTQVDDNGIAVLKALPRLKALRLCHTQISNEALVHLRQMESIEQLSLTGTRIDIQGLKMLQDHPKLRDLSAEETQVSERELRRFMKTLRANQKQPQREQSRQQ
jgi:internalin A